jgi:hypothetical protein
MKRFSILEPLYLSFYSSDLYRDVRTNWKGTGFLYLLLLLAVTWLPVMYKLHVGIAESVQQEAPKYLDQVPKITIVRGEVSIDRPVPYTISDPDGGTPLMVIDTSGTITSFEQTKALVLLTKNKLMYQQPNRAETRIYDLSKVDGLTIDREFVNGWVQAFRKYFTAIAYPFALAGSFSYRVLQLLIYAAIGMLFVNLLKVQMDYMAVLRLASVSITPVIILTTLRTLTGFHVPLFWLLCFVLAMGYLFFAVKANSVPAPTKTPGDAV